MNIILINHYAGLPNMGMEYRPYYLAKEWVNMGHNVWIIVATHSHIRKINKQQNEKLKIENIDGINYVWIKTPEYKGNGLGRIKNMLAFIKTGMFKASFFVKEFKPDVVIASSTYPSDNYIARKICKLSKAKHIYEVHDLWPLSPMELGGMSKNHPFIIAMQHAENFAYKKADAVISMLPKTQEHMQSHGLDLKKWHYIPNGIVVDEWENNDDKVDEEYRNILEELKIKGKTIVGYTGGHALSNSLKTIVETAEKLQNNKNIVFVLVGNGAEKQNLINLSKNLDNIIFLNPVPKNQIPDLLSKMDYLIITWNKTKLYRFGISPNKIYDYMMAKKPIIHATDAPNKFVDEANCGIAVGAEKPDEIVDAIIKLKSMPEDKLKEMGQNGYDYVLKNYDYKILAKKFINVMNNL